MPNYPSIYLELQKIWEKLDDLATNEKDLTGNAGGILIGKYPAPSGLQSTSPTNDSDPLTLTGSLDVSLSVKTNKITSKSSRSEFVNRELTLESSGSINLSNHGGDNPLRINVDKGLDFHRTGSTDNGLVYRQFINNIPVLSTGYYDDLKRGYIELKGSGSNDIIGLGVDGNHTQNSYSQYGSGPLSYLHTTNRRLHFSINGSSSFMDTDSFYPGPGITSLGTNKNRWDVLANKINLYSDHPSANFQRFSIYPTSGRDIIYDATSTGVEGAAHVFRANGYDILYIVKDNDQNAVAPSNNDETHLGEPSQRWKNVYTNDINTPVATLEQGSSKLELQAGVQGKISVSSSAPELWFKLTDTTTGPISKNALYIKATPDMSNIYTFPDSDHISHLGISTYRWDNVWAENVNSTGITVGANGITFPDAPATGGSSENQTLKYYESGLFGAYNGPSTTISGSDFNSVISNKHGYIHENKFADGYYQYERIGNIVHIYFRFKTTADKSLENLCFLLPFTPKLQTPFNYFYKENTIDGLNNPNGLKSGVVVGFGGDSVFHHGIIDLSGTDRVARIDAAGQNLDTDRYFVVSFSYMAVP